MAYRLLAILTICFLALPALPAFEARANEPAAGRFAESAVTHQALEDSIRTGLDKVEEIKFLREEMAKLGLKHGWLFGGTAAAFGHYANWDLRRRQGDQRFQPNRFDYDYTNIFRSTQDLDIVIDGTPEQAEALERRLREIYPHLQGTQSAWEVRLLNKDRGSKEALVGNPNFLNQHTDSNSTGLIEFTQPKDGAPLVTDLRDQGPSYPKFFEDIRLGKLKYYFSPTHESTNRFKKGLNPPIFSVVRYLTKLFQYELEVDPEDVEHIRKIVKDFKPATLTEREAQNWIKKNGKKIFQNAVNLEYAANTLQELGLKDKLASFDSPAEVNSLAWWVNRKPLASKPVGKGPGATAASLGLDVVAHETSDYLAYESITRSHTGEPNVFTSRTDAAGEMAAFGEGFYTKVGKEGARGTGITIRFKIDPNAREGADFTLERGSQYVIFHNKQALSVIPESLDLTPKQFFDLLIKNGATWGQNDKSIIEKFRRRMRNRLMAKPGEVAEIAGAVNGALMKEASNSTLLKEWIAFTDQIKGQKELMEPLLRPLTQSRNAWVSLLANMKLAERGLPIDIDLKKLLPNTTYFKALMGFGPTAYEPEDPYFRRLVTENFKNASPAQVKETFGLIKGELKAAGPNPVPDQDVGYLISQWRSMWEEAYHKSPMEMKAIAREMAEDPDFRVVPRYMAMDALNASLKVQKDPELIDFLLKRLADPQRASAYRAIVGLAAYAPDDPRVAKALAAYIDHADDATRSHVFAAFEKVKTADPAIHHQLIEAMGKSQPYSSNARLSLVHNMPADQKSADMLDEMIRVKDFRAAFAIEVRGLMPDHGKDSLGVLVDALKNTSEDSVALAAAKVLVGHPEKKQMALGEAFKRLRNAKLANGFDIIDLSEFLFAHDHNLPLVIEKLNHATVADGGISWKTRPLIERISERIKSMPARSSPTVDIADCPASFGKFTR